MIWGSIPDWIAAVGTILAVSVSVSLAAFEIRQRRRSETLLAGEGERARSTDAASVVAWVETKQVKGKSRSTLRLLNAGRRPVFAITMVPVSYGGFRRGQRIVTPVLGPGMHLDEPFDGEVNDLLAPEHADDHYVHPDPAARIGVKLIFRDSAGLNWERGIDGRLRERDWNYADDEFPGEPDYRGSAS